MAMFSPSIFTASPMFSTGTVVVATPVVTGAGGGRKRHLARRNKKRRQEEDEVMSFIKSFMKTRGR